MLATTVLATTTRARGLSPTTTRATGPPAATLLAPADTRAGRPVRPRCPARSGEGAIAIQVRLVKLAVVPALLHSLSLARGSPGRPARLREIGQQTGCDIAVTSLRYLQHVPFRGAFRALNEAPADIHGIACAQRPIIRFACRKAHACTRDQYDSRPPRYF